MDRGGAALDGDLGAERLAADGFTYSSSANPDSRSLLQVEPVAAELAGS
jgi:hypothetical protein